MFRYASTSALLSIMMKIKYLSNSFQRYYFRSMITNINPIPRAMYALCDLFGVTYSTFKNYSYNEPAEPMMKRIVHVVKLNVNAELIKRGIDV